MRSETAAIRNVLSDDAAQESISIRGYQKDQSDKECIHPPFCVDFVDFRLMKKE